MIYFDNASTTKPHQAILDLYNRVNTEYWYNESSAHHLGVTCRTLLTKANDSICRTLNLTNKLQNNFDFYKLNTKSLHLLQ